MHRRQWLFSAAAWGCATGAHAQAVALAAAPAVEKHALTIAVGGKSLLYYLPLTVADSLGYFKAEGLDVTIADFAGGSRALQALVGGSADVVSGAFEHTLNMQTKGQALRCFVLQGRAPQIVLGIGVKAMPKYRTVADLKGKKIGVTAPGSSTHTMVNIVLGQAGLKPSDVSIIGVGAGSSAVAAMRSGQIDAISAVDPVITMLQRAGELKVVFDTRNVAVSDKIFGGPMPAACLYAPLGFISKYPGTTQALTNAIVRANKWIQTAGPSDIIKAVPEAYLLGDRAVYLDAFLAVKGAMSFDGAFRPEAAATAAAALRSADASLAQFRFDLATVFTNDFVKRANERYPQG